MRYDDETLSMKKSKVITNIIQLHDCLGVVVLVIPRLTLPKEILKLVRFPQYSTVESNHDRRTDRLYCSTVQYSRDLPSSLLGPIL